MAKEASVHSNMLTDAARHVLRPMGLVQKGRSRIWLDDLTSTRRLFAGCLEGPKKAAAS